MRFIAGVVLAGVVGVVAAGCAQGPRSQSPTTSKAVATTQMGGANTAAVEAAGNVRMKDWKPESSLVVPRTNVPKAKFPAIDAHSHVYGVDTPEKVAERVKMMD